MPFSARYKFFTFEKKAIDFFMKRRFGILRDQVVAETFYQMDRVKQKDCVIFSFSKDKYSSKSFDIEMFTTNFPLIEM